MKKRILLILTLVSAAGCVDTPDSVCREFLNANNEHIDALMMVTSERQALNMSVRVFSKMSDRYRDLDKKWEIMEQGMGFKPRLDDKKAFLESDGLHLYRAEYKINAQRCTLELAHIRNLLGQLVEQAKEQARANGEDPEEVRPERWPKLHDIVNTKYLGTLRTQLENPKLEQLLNRFNGGMDLANAEDKAVMKIFEDKHNRFNGLKKEKDGKLTQIPGMEPIVLAR